MQEENIINQSNVEQAQPVELSNLNVQDSNETELKTKAIIKRNNFGIFLALLPVSLFLSLGAIFAFDAPGSENSLPTIIFAYSPLLYIPFYMVSIILSWILFKMKQYKFAIFASYLPFLNVIGFAVGLMLVMFVCGGSFVCR